MSKTRRPASAILSTAIAFLLAFGAPLCEAQTIAAGRVAPVPAAGLSGLAGAQVYKVELPSLSIKGGSLQTTAPGIVGANNAQVTPAPAVEAAPSVAAGPSLQPYPVFDVLNKLEAAGVNLNGGGSQADAARLEAAAQALPAGPARDNLVMMAKAISASNAEVGTKLDKVYDNANAAGAGDAAVVETGGGVWSTLSRVRLLPRSLRRKFAAKAEKNRLKAQPRDPAQFEVPVERLRWTPAADQLPESTKDVAKVPAQIVGQDRALRALSFGLRMPGDRYNIFVSGLEGSGRETAVREALAKLAPTMPTPKDMVAVTNFSNPDVPAILKLRPGAAPVFKAAVADFTGRLAAVLPQALESPELAKAKKMIGAKLAEAAAERQAALDAEIASVKLGRFGISVSAQQQDNGYALVVAPTLDGKPLTAEDLKEAIASGKVSQAEWDEAQSKAGEAAQPFVEKYKEMLSQNSQDESRAAELLQGLQAKAAAGVIDQLGEGLRQAVLGGGAVDDKALAKAKERLDAMMAELRREVAQVKLGKFGALLDMVEGPDGNMKIAVGLTYEGRPITRETIEANGIGLDEVKAAQAELKKTIKPYVEKLKAMVEGYQKELAEAVEGSKAKPGPEDTPGLMYVESLLGHAAARYEDFLPKQQAGGLMAMLGGGAQEQSDPSENYKVNVIATNKADGGAPVVFEKSPSFERLFGAVESKAQAVPGVGVVKVKTPGGPTLRAGSFQQANGGFLVLNAMDVLRSPGAWPMLMRAIRSGQAAIVEGGPEGGAAYATPAKVKVVLIGSPMVKMLLQSHDEDFVGNFNAAAEFQSVMDITKETLDGFLSFLKKMVIDGAGQVLNMNREAISAIMEYSARLAGSNEKLSAQFGATLGLMREASFWAKESGREMVTRDDVRAALKARDDREGGGKARYHEIFTKGVFRIDTSGAQVGQVNGLAVMGNFGVPARVTVVSSPGKAGLISVDRDAGQTGPSFNKALGIIEGFLEHTFGQKRPVSAHLRVAFEQNYGGIDGDSATSTEIYAILSSLSGVPIQQRFAVTGSADQFGNVQAIGGANEKIEGFYAVAVNKAYQAGLNAVLVPAANVGDLQLSEEVVKAVKEGRFKIYQVKHVSEGIEILTGEAYPEILRKAQQRLSEFAEAATPAVVVKR